MTYKVVDIEGVGEVYAEKLIAAGIKTDAELLEKCAKPAGRKELAEATEISPKLNDQRKVEKRAYVSANIKYMADTAMAVSN